MAVGWVVKQPGKSWMGAGAYLSDNSSNTTPPTHTQPQPKQAKPPTEVKTPRQKEE